MQVHMQAPVLALHLHMQAHASPCKPYARTTLTSQFEMSAIGGQVLSYVLVQNLWLPWLIMRVLEFCVEEEGGRHFELLIFLLRATHRVAVISALAYALAYASTCTCICKHDAKSSCNDFSVMQVHMHRACIVFAWCKYSICIVFAWELHAYASPMQARQTASERERTDVRVQFCVVPNWYFKK